MQKIPCSIPILTLNSGKTLRRCLASVQDFDDVYLLDGNSTDDTLMIAKEFGRSVYKQYETDEKNIRIKNFSEIRIKADSLAKHDWIFLVDSDEFISEELTAAVRRIFYDNPDPQTAYFTIKKVILGNKLIEYSWHNSPYILRLYNKQSGVRWKGSKIVHEQIYIPDDIKIVRLPYIGYSQHPASYRAAIKKDDYYLSLMRQKMFLKKRSEKSKKLILFSIIKNLLRAVNIFYKSIKVYWRHGFKQTLPIRHVWRFMRYHIIISYYRLQELFR